MLANLMIHRHIRVIQILDDVVYHIISSDMFTSSNQEVERISDTLTQICNVELQ